MKLYYNTVSNDLVTIDASGETWTQGDVDSKTLEVYFGTVSGEVFTVNTGLVLTHECRIVVERPDGAVSPELYLTPQLDGSYRLVISGWIAGVEGNVKITPRLKLGDVVTSFGLAIIAVAEGILPADSVITPEEYNLLLVAINDLAKRVTINEGDIVSLETFQAAMIAGTQAVRKIKYDTANPATTFSIIGETRYSDTYKTIETRLSSSTILQHGLEVLAYVRNGEANTLVNGEIVYITDETVGGSSHVIVKRASNDNDSAYAVLGIVTENSILTNASGFVVLIGEMTLSGYPAGKPLYLGVGGALTITKPTAPARVVKMGTAAPNTRAFILPHITPSLQILSDTNIDVTGMTKPVLTKVSNHWVAYDIAPYEADLAQALIDIGVAENDIDALEGRMDTAEGDIDALQADVVDLETANMVKTVTFNATNGVLTFTRYNDTTFTLDLPTELIVSSGEYDEVNKKIILTLASGGTIEIPVEDIFVGLATESWVGTQLESYYTKTAADLLLDDKVDKVTGKSLIDDTEITRLLGIETAAEVNVIEVVKVDGTPLVVADKTVDIDLTHKLDKDLSNDTTYPPKTTLVGTEDVYIDDNGVAKKTTMTDIATFVGGETGTFVPSGDYQGDGLGAYESAVLDVHDVTLHADGDFRCSIKAIETDKILYVQFPTVTATANLRLSTDNGSTYYNVLKNGSTVRASAVSGLLVRMYFNGTNFIAEMQDDVHIEETMQGFVDSTYGKFNPQKDGVPLLKEVKGMLLESANKFNLVTGTVNGVTYTIVGNQITLSGTASAETTLTLASGLTATSKAYIYQDYVSGTTGGVITLKNGATSLHATYNTDYSGVVVLEGTTLTLVIANGAVLTNVIYKYNINVVSVLISNKQYSPLYNTTFDLMSDGQIKAQMDEWVLNGTLPNSIQAVNFDKTFTSVGKNLFDGEILTDKFYLANTGILTDISGVDYKYSLDYIKVKPSTNYRMSINGVLSDNWSDMAMYDINKNIITSYHQHSNSLFTTTSNTYYVRISWIGGYNIQLELGTVATTYVPYRSSSMQLITGQEGYNIGATHDTVELKGNRYYLMKRIGSDDIDGVVAVNTTNYPLAKSGGVWINYLTVGGSETGIIGTDSTSGAGFLVYEYATPIETEIQTEGLLTQDDTTTIYQDGTLATSYDVEFAMNTDQSVATLVERDRIQQHEIDGHEGRLDTVEPKVTTLEGEMDIVQGDLSQAQDDISSLQTNAEMKANKVTAFSTPTDTEYPSAKLVKDNLDLKANASSLSAVATSGAYADLTGTPSYTATLLGSRTNAGTISVSGWSNYDDIRMVVEYVNSGVTPNIKYQTAVQMKRGLLNYHAVNPNGALTDMISVGVGTPTINEIKLTVDSGTTSVTIEKNTILGGALSLNIYVYGIKYLGV